MFEDCQPAGSSLTGVHGRETLLEVAAAGPAAGAAASLVAVAVGLALSAGGSGGIQFEPGAFDDSLLIGGLGACFHLLTTPFSKSVPQGFFC